MRCVTMHVTLGSTTNRNVFCNTRISAVTFYIIEVVLSVYQINKEYVSSLWELEFTLRIRVETILANSNLYTNLSQ